MRIAQVAPLMESVPPKAYGGTERIVSYLTEELVALGHDVTLFASGDSSTRAKLVPVTPTALRSDSRVRDIAAPHVLMLELVAQSASEFDVVHFHIDHIQFPLARRLGVPHVTTKHGRLDLAEVVSLHREFRDMPLVSISDSQREPLSEGRWMATIHHGLPPDLYTLHEEPAGYLAFLGRISPEKRLDRAIEIARGCGLPLKIAAKIDDADREYFERDIAPLLNDPLVEYLGEVGETGKRELLGNALALLFPIDWPEPFGLVMIEAMACGTPVIAFPCGSVPEVIRDGVNGYIVKSIEEAVDAVGSLNSFDRGRCRDVFEQRYSARRMAEDYLPVYEAVSRTDTRALVRGLLPGRESPRRGTSVASTPVL